MILIELASGYQTHKRLRFLSTLQAAIAIQVNMMAIRDLRVCALIKAKIVLLLDEIARTLFLRNVFFDETLHSFLLKQNWVLYEKYLRTT